MEVDEKAYVLAAQLQVRQKLRLVNGMKALGALQFDNNRVLDRLLSQLMSQAGSISAPNSPGPRSE